MEYRNNAINQIQDALAEEEKRPVDQKLIDLDYKFLQKKFSGLKQLAVDSAMSNSLKKRKRLKIWSFGIGLIENKYRSEAVKELKRQEEFNRLNQSISTLHQELESSTNEPQRRSESGNITTSNMLDLSHSNTAVNLTGSLNISRLKKSQFARLGFTDSGDTLGLHRAESQGSGSKDRTFIDTGLFRDQNPESVDLEDRWLNSSSFQAGKDSNSPSRSRLYSLFRIPTRKDTLLSKIEEENTNRLSGIQDQLSIHAQQPSKHLEVSVVSKSNEGANLNPQRASTTQNLLANFADHLPPKTLFPDLSLDAIQADPQPIATHLSQLHLTASPDKSTPQQEQQP